MAPKHNPKPYLVAYRNLCITSMNKTAAAYQLNYGVTLSKAHASCAKKVPEYQPAKQIADYIDHLLMLDADPLRDVLNDHGRRMTACAEVEEKLLRIANGKDPLPTREQCRDFANILAGTKP